MLRRLPDRLFVFLFLCASCVSVAPSALASEHCDEARAVARVVSFQADVTVDGQSVLLGAPICTGMVLRTGPLSRAGVMLLEGETVLRVHENSEMSFQPKQNQRWYLNLPKGLLYLFSRVPESLEVETPYVNGGIEGTEFLVYAGADESRITVLEGVVSASNAFGQETVRGGESVTASRGTAPRMALTIRPVDAVQWTIYFPPTLPQNAPEEIALAARLLAAGRVDEALRQLEAYPSDASALSVRTIAAVMLNDPEQALRFATSAVELEPSSVAARIAYSYALQASFDLPGALEQAELAVDHSHDDGLAYARLAELQLANGLLRAARVSAEEAQRLAPDNALAMTMKGYVLLSSFRARAAASAFEGALRLQSEDPLPRLGLALAQIRLGRLSEGRQQMEIAIAHDPANSLLRSYLGKAYFEENRFPRAAVQYDIAKRLDPKDPTPWYYGAFLLQSENRPIPALRSLQTSVELNDNRAVYRSRFLLDQDLASRGASVGAIYQSLGFPRLAELEAWKSLSINPANSSAHQLLGDSYSVLERRDIARDSELLQAQLLQTVNTTPVSPRLATDGLRILDDLGLSGTGLSDYSMLFDADGVNLQLSGLVGSQGTLAGSAIAYGAYGPLSFSTALMNYETDGFQPNTRQTDEFRNLYLQYSPAPSTTFITDLRITNQDAQAQRIYADLELAPLGVEDNIEQKSARFSFRHHLAPGNTVLASYARQWAETSLYLPPEPGYPVDFSIVDKGRIDSGEVQYLLSVAPTWNLTLGARQSQQEIDGTLAIAGVESPLETISEEGRAAYVYGNLNLPKTVRWTLGVSADEVDALAGKRSTVNPKLGVAWEATASTLLRAAAFRTLQPLFIGGQSLEPTQIAGFNQFFDGFNGEDAWNYGVGLDQQFSNGLFGGLELARREIKIPASTFMEEDWEPRYREKLLRAYLYAIVTDDWALSADYAFSRYDRPKDTLEQFTRFSTHYLPLEARYSGSDGINARLRGTFVHQNYRYEGFDDYGVWGDQEDSEHFWVFDVFFGYRLPKRMGIVGMEVRNLTDERINYRTLDRATSILAEERQVLFVTRFNLGTR